MKEGEVRLVGGWIIEFLFQTIILLLQEMNCILNCKVPTALDRHIFCYLNLHFKTTITFLFQADGLCVSTYSDFQKCLVPAALSY